MNIRNFTTLAFALLLGTFSAPGQNRVDIKQNSFVLKGDSVYVGMDIDLNGVKPRKRAFVLLTPYLKAERDITMDLPSVMIDGKNRYRAYKRLVALHREPLQVGQVIDAAAKDAPQSYRYRAAVAYEPWMSRAGFHVREDQCECSGPLVPISYELIATTLDDRNPAPVPPQLLVDLNFAVSFKVPNPEPVKMRSETGKAYLDFARGQSAVDPGFGNNRSELSAIGQTIQSVKNDPNITITNILIDGYASPEGTYAANMTLSGKRAVALKNYLRNTYGLKEILFKVTGRGEDWSLLEALVQESSMVEKEQVLAIIRGTDIFDGRERKLMDLRGGDPYRYMLENIFPKLRRCDYEVKYSVAPFSVEQGKLTMQTNPSLLSLDEMFLIAQTYRVGGDDYDRVFTVAAERFPQSDVANMNAAANALSRGNHQAAVAYLDKVRGRDAAWENNFGVACAQRGDYDKAAAHFEKAGAGGNAEAAGNLEQLKKIARARAKK